MQFNEYFNQETEEAIRAALLSEDEELIHWACAQRSLQEYHYESAFGSDY